jgi:hypothetical protein
MLARPRSRAHATERCSLAFVSALICHPMLMIMKTLD